MAQLVFGDVSCTLFRVHSSWGPYFAVREFDSKVIRSPSKFKKGRGPSEQAIRASIRQAILNMNLKSERASKAEIRLMKAQGILGKRAPSCSLLNAEDMIKLLESFGKTRCASDLRTAVDTYRKQHPAVPGEEPAAEDGDHDHDHDHDEEEGGEGEEKAHPDEQRAPAQQNHRDLGSPLYRPGAFTAVGSSSSSRRSTGAPHGTLPSDLARLQRQLDQEQDERGLSLGGHSSSSSSSSAIESPLAQKRARPPSLPMKHSSRLMAPSDNTKRRRTDGLQSNQQQSQGQGQSGQQSPSLAARSSAPLHRSGSAPNLVPNNHGLDTLLSAVVAAHEKLRPDPLNPTSPGMSSLSGASSLIPGSSLTGGLSLKQSPLSRGTQPLRSFPTRMLSPITTPLSPSAVFRPTPSPPPPSLLPESSSPRSPSALAPPVNGLNTQTGTYSLNGYSLMSNGPPLSNRSSVFGNSDLDSQSQQIASSLSSSTYDLSRGQSPFSIRVTASQMLGQPKTSPPASPNPLLSSSYLSRPPRSPSLGTPTETSLNSLPSMGSFEFLPPLPLFGTVSSTGSMGSDGLSATADKLQQQLSAQPPPQLTVPQISDPSTTRHLRTFNLAAAAVAADRPEREMQYKQEENVAATRNGMALAV